MNKYILIEGDYNDGDYDSRISTITDEEIEFIKPIIKAIKDNNKSYLSGDLASIGESAEEDYGHLDCYELFDKLTPFGDSEYSGIHTIKSIKVIQILEEML